MEGGREAGMEGGREAGREAGRRAGREGVSNYLGALYSCSWVA